MNKIIHFLFPLRNANKHIDGKIQEINEKYFVDISKSKDKHKDFEIFEKELKSQLDRKKGIEDKAKSILFSVTLSVTILIFSVNSLKLNYSNSFDYISLVILIIAVFYLIRSAYFSLKALEVKEYNYLVTTKNDTVAEKIELIKNNEETVLINAIKTKILNDFRIIKISNYVSIAYSSIKNGIIGFAIVLIMLLIHSFFSTP